MVEPTGPGMTPPRRRPADTVIVVAVVQLLAWLVTASLPDGGVVCGVYTRLLVAYWLLIGTARLIVRGPALGWVVAASGWTPLIGAAVWVWCGFSA